MKIEYDNDRLIVYLFNYDIDISNTNEINDKIKKIFVKLIRYYNLDLYGFCKVTIYHNKKYGMVLDIKKICNNEYQPLVIDLKIIVYKDSIMYLEFDDYIFLDKPKDLIVKNKKYYLNIDNIDNICNYIEYGKLIFEKN